MANYVVYHMHSDLSVVAGVDSVTKYGEYVNRAKELGMTSLGFSEHGNIFEWYHKKQSIEKAGMRYIHAAEIYLTESLSEKVRDNYHLVLIAKNFEGFLELNKMLSRSFNREDGHYYYSPRITFDELFATSENIIFSTACFDENAIVRTENGSKKIVDIKCGDMVLTENGSFRSVDALTHRKYDGELYSIKAHGMLDTLRCTKDHKFFVKREGGAVWIEACELKLKDTLLTPITKRFEEFDVLDLRDCKNFDGRCKKHISKEIVDVNPELLTLLGIYCAEGSFLSGNSGIRFTLNSNDKTIIDVVSQSMFDVFGLSPYIKIKHNENAYDYEYSSTEIFNVFSRLFKSGASNKNIPQFVMSLKPEMQMFFLKGLYMGDGHFDYKEDHRLAHRGKVYVSKRVNFCTISVDLCCAVIEILNRNGINPSVKTSEPYTDKKGVNHRRAYYIDFNGSCAEKMIDFVFCKTYHNFVLGSDTLYKTHQIFVFDGTEYMQHKIKKLSFENVSNFNVYCLNVNDIHSFLANNVVVHNCIGGVLGRGSEELQKELLNYMMYNSDRCFLEVQHHNVKEQIEYNKRMLAYSKEYGIPLIAGTDTHSLNSKHAEGRKILQVSKGVRFDDEEEWDLTFKTYEELVEAYKNQGSLEESVYMEAIENTNVMASMVDDFSIDTSNKYPKIYDNPVQKFREEIDYALLTHPYVYKNHSKAKVEEVINREFDAYVKTGSHEFMLLENYKLQWEREHGVRRGVGRGSVNGSFIAYVLGITKMDSIRFDLNFFRFINPDRVSLADIDTDYGAEDRDKVKQFLLRDKMDLPNLRSSEIITFNTISLKGSINDVARALKIPLEKARLISDAVTEDEEQKQTIDQKWRDKYPELFYYVDIVIGTIVSVGSHPSGVLLSDLDIESNIGVCTVANNEYPVSMLNMKELDSINYVKMDILGLDNLALINKTCELAGIPVITPDNIDLEIEEVWKDLVSDTTGVFQWESAMGQQYAGRFFSENTLSKAKQSIDGFKYFKWLSFANGALRPGCASFRDDLADGKTYDNGMPEINKFLEKTMGYVVMQEDVINFLTNFCGYSPAEADTVRRSIAKKGGTEKLLPEIEKRFVEFVHKKYKYEREHATKVIQSFLKVVEDASSYMFSWNHSDAYSFIGYAVAYLRHYYPIEFATTALNVFKSKEEKTIKITNYAAKNGIKIIRPKFRYSKSEYYMDKENKSVYKGIESIKYMNSSVADGMQQFYDRKYNNFVGLLYDLSTISINTKQLDILIKIGFFSEFGNISELLEINNYYNLYGKSKVISKEDISDQIVRSIIARNSRETEKQYRPNDNQRKILEEIGQYVMSLDMPDVTFKEKVEYQQEHLGYVNLSTGLPEDVTKLIIVGIEPMKTKDKKKVWAYKVTTSSLGSGKKSELMVNSRVFESSPLNKYDVIFTKREWLEKQVVGKYTNWYLKSYRIV